MVNIIVSRHEVPIITMDGRRMFVKLVLVHEADDFIHLQDWEPSKNQEEVNLILIRRFSQKRLDLPDEIQQSISFFLQNYHAKQDTSFDCYAFVNLTKGVETHTAPQMLKYWKRRPLPWLLPIGSVVFLESGDNQFHHAAVYLGHGLCISVWGAGGDLEVATLKAMKRDYGAESVVLAEPIRI